MFEEYNWTITEDKINEGNAEVGTVGPRTATLTAEAIRKHKKRQRFRLLDDDGEVYFVGYLVEGSGVEDCLAPLYDIGFAYGCTELQLWKSGKGGGWETP